MNKTPEQIRELAEKATLSLRFDSLNEQYEFIHGFKKGYTACQDNFDCKDESQGGLKCSSQCEDCKSQNDDGWVSVKDRLPEFKETSYWYDDNNIRKILEKNDHAIVLGYNEIYGFYKVKLDNYGWTAMAPNVSNGTKSAIPTHWKEIQPPKK